MSEIGPAYVRVRQYVLSQIYSADTNRKIPAERELCEIFKVTRGAARYALDSLVKEGYLVRHHGSGTFINPDRLTPPELRKKTVGFIFGGGQTNNYNGDMLETMSRIFSIMARRDMNVRQVQLLDDADQALRQLESLRLDAVLWYNPGPEKNGPFVARCFRELGVPIMIGAWNVIDDYRDYVTMDMSGPARAATAFLLERGHRKIAFAVEKKEFSSYRDQYEGFCRAFRESGATADASPRLTDAAALRQEAMELFERQDVTAVYCVAGGPQFDIMKAVKETRGKVAKLPEIVTYENDISRLFSDVPFHAIRYPRFAIAEEAAERICDLLERKIFSPVRRVISGEWTINESGKP